MSVCSGIQAAFRISQKYWKGYLDPEKMVKTHKKSTEHGWKTNCNLKHKRITAMIQTALKIDYIHMPQQNV